MINAKDIGKILSFVIGGIVLSVIFRNPNPMIAGFIVAFIMLIVKGFFRGTPNLKTKPSKERGA